MAIQPVRLYPDPILRQKSEIVDLRDDRTADVVRDLWDTLDSHAGVGIAAPQIGQSVRIIALDATRAKRPVPNHGRIVLINPEIIVAEGETSFREGCLSIPDLVARITRSERVTVAAMSVEGNPVAITAEGFEAVILQHEIDHLNGVLFIDRVRSARDLKIRNS
jgi:peptide deformylase